MVPGLTPDNACNKQIGVLIKEYDTPFARVIWRMERGFARHHF